MPPIALMATWRKSHQDRATRRHVLGQVIGGPKRSAGVGDAGRVRAGLERRTAPVTAPFEGGAGGNV